MASPPRCTRAISVAEGRTAFIGFSKLAARVGAARGGRRRLAALVPRPRLHLIRFHGVLAPNAKLRSLVVPQGPPKDEQAAGVAASGVQCEAQTYRLTKRT